MKIEYARDLTRYRRRTGLSKRELAQKIGVSRDTITRIEGFSASEPDTRYPYIPSLTVAIKLSQFLDVQVQDLVTRKDVKQGHRVPISVQAQPLSSVVVTGAWPFGGSIPTSAD